MVSAPGEPLQALIGLQDLTPDEAASLRVSVADQAAWQRVGLKPPAPLSSLTVRVEEGMDPTRKNLRVRSAQAPAGGVVDLVLNIRSSTGQRQVQVSILVPLRGAGVDVASAAVGTPRRAVAGRAGSIPVKSGDTLFALAQRHAVPNASVYQMMAALWRANPDAFIQNNMNLVRVGQALVLPDAAAARAVSSADARHIFSEHAAAFARYRARIGAASGAKPVLLKDQDAASGTVTPADDTGNAVAPESQDRVRLSSGQDQDGGAAARADQQVSNARAMADAQDRINQLQSNVEALNKAMAAQNASASRADTPAAQRPEDAAGAVGESASPAAAGTLGTADTTGVSGASRASDVAPAAGTVSPPTPDQTVTDVAAERRKEKQAATFMPAWLTDNLLVIVTAVLALLAFVIAWMLRRAGARRGDDDEETYAYDEETYAYDDRDAAALNRRLDNIDFDLDQPPADEPNRARGSRM